MFKIFDRVKQISFKVEDTKVVESDDIGGISSNIINSLFKMEAKGYDAETVLHEALLFIELDNYTPDFDGKCKIKPNRTPKLFDEDITYAV